MRSTVSGIVTIHDLYKFFTGEEHGWKSDFDQDGFTAKSDKAKLDLIVKPTTVMFDVHIEAQEDSEDFHDVVTDNPIKEITKFLGEGVPGSEHFEKIYSFNMKEMHGLLHYARNAVLSYAMNRRQLASYLRRISILPTISAIPYLKSVAAICLIAREEIDIKEIARLKEQLSKKGWRVNESEDKRGIPTLEMDIGDVYRANITVEKMLYEYEFHVMGEPDADKSGVTDDPIAEFDTWVRDPQTTDFRNKAKGSDATVKPESKPEPGSKATVPARKS